MASIAVADHVAFVDAARRGDLSAVKRFFARPEVLANAALWENYFRHRRLNNITSEASRYNSMLPCPWFYNFQSGFLMVWSSLVGGMEVVEILRWLFSDQGLALVGETLRAFMLDISVETISMHLTALQRLEAVIESRLFQETMDDQERKTTLAHTIVRCARYGYAPLVDALLAYGADPNAEHHDPAFPHGGIETPLAMSIFQGYATIVDNMLAHGAWVDDDRVLAGGWRSRKPQLIRKALQHGADANRFSSQFGTPFHHATDVMRIPAMESLVNDGFADFDGRDRRGRTPLMVTAAKSDESWPYEDKERTAEWLIDRDADLRAVDPNGRGVIHWAVRGKSINLLKLFLSRGANPNSQDRLGRTPMATLLIKARYRVTRKVKQVLELLLEAGADPLVRDRSGKCAAQMLTRVASGEQFLKDHRINVVGLPDATGSDWTVI